VGLGVDDGADLRVLGLQDGRGAGNLAGLGHLANFHRNVDAGGLIEHEREWRMHRSLETGRSDFDLIHSDRNAGQTVGTGVVGFRGPCSATLDVRRSYGCTANWSSTRIGHRTDD